MSKQTKLNSEGKIVDVNRKESFLKNELMESIKILLILVISHTAFVANAQIGINIAKPDDSAILHIESSTKGFLPPRLSEASMNAMANVTGMMVYCLDCEVPCLYMNDGSQFVTLCRDPSMLRMVSSGTFVEGLYINGTTFTSDNKLILTVRNTGTVAENLTLQTADLTLSGTASSGITVTGVSPASINIQGLTSETIEFQLSGTPSSTGVITAVFTNGNLNLSTNINVTNGDANTNDEQVFVVSIYDVGPPVVNTPGTIDNASNQITFNLPYTNGSGTYNAYTSTYVTSLPGTSESSNSNGFRITYPSGNFSSATGTIPVILEVDGDGTFDPKQIPLGDTMLIAEIPVQINGNPKSVVKLVIRTLPEDMLFGTYSTNDSGHWGSCSNPSNAFQGAQLRTNLTDGVFSESGYGSQNTLATSFLEINLGAVYTVTGVKVAGGSLSCWSSSLAAYHPNDRVQYYNTTSNSWVSIWNVTGTNNTSITEHTFSTPIRAQRIRISKVSTGWISYGEFYPVGYF